MKRSLVSLPLVLITVLLLAACGGASSGTAPQSNAPEATAAQNAAPEAAPAGGKTLILGAYTTPREAYAKLLPIFKEQWKQQSGEDITFQESYQGSGAQSRAIVEGFEADVAALSLEADIDRITKAGLITHDWKSGQYKGMVSDSLVAFAVRKGNPKGIKDWADLAKPGVEVLTPNPKTSGGAQWNIMALYGAAKRGFVSGVPKDDDAAATEFLKAVLKNVSVMDKGARESITNFEQGVGDVAITYENEVLVGQKNGQDYELVIPRSTILIENPIAVVDKYVDAHGTRKAAEAFVEFLYTPEAQQIFADYGLRSVDANVAKATAERYPAVEDQFQIDYFGGWAKVTPEYFGDDGL
ncbi:MAG TPA: sulfate ABC transporter substrate-binding protein, partial [Roseiflexaceae bacterium]|nr:sulfate ABC transporter substrate-binding protein [Roseiflexaceae bacterium]